jgi:hypothetical protein
MARISVEKMGASSGRRAVKQAQPIITAELERGRIFDISALLRGVEIFGTIIYVQSTVFSIL